jgi:hypothetical protein
MVATKAPSLNKSAAIRTALAQYPNKGPAELARILSQQHGVPFQAKAISGIKTLLGRKPAAAQKPAVPVTAPRTPVQRPLAGPAVSRAAGGMAVMVSNLQAYIQRWGKDDLHRLIDTL